MGYITSPLLAGARATCRFNITVINGYRRVASHVRHEASSSTTLDYIMEDSRFDLRVLPLEGFRGDLFRDDFAYAIDT